MVTAIMPGALRTGLYRASPRRGLRPGDVEALNRCYRVGREPEVKKSGWSAVMPRASLGRVIHHMQPLADGGSPAGRLWATAVTIVEGVEIGCGPGAAASLERHLAQIWPLVCELAERPAEELAVEARSALDDLRTDADEQLRFEFDPVIDEFDEEALWRAVL